MDALVVVEASTGSLRRYEVGGERPLLSHEATVGERRTFTVGVVEEFRVSPDPAFAVNTDEAPPPLPPSVGAVSIA